MRWIIALILPSLALAQGRPLTSQLLLCLGEEEKALHQSKTTGAVYDLNQRIIGELILINGLEGSADLVKGACGAKGSAAVWVMREMLLRPKSWFVLKPQNSTMENSISVELVKDLNMIVPEILLTYISMLQAESATPDCLEKHIPGLKKLHLDVRFLQEEVDLTKITKSEKRLAKIFARLSTPAPIQQKCREEAQRKLKSKKTDKGSGKPSPQ
jgi:hypothetical protein